MNYKQRIRSNIPNMRAKKVSYTDSQLSATLCTRSLHSAALFAYNQASESYTNANLNLQGVYVEISTNSVMYVATNGIKMFATRHMLNAPPNSFTGKMIIPTEHCLWDTEALADLPQEVPVALITHEDGSFGMRGLERRMFRPIVGDYPDWRKTLKTSGELCGKPQAIDWTHMSTFTEAVIINPLLGIAILYPSDSGKNSLVRYSGDMATGVIAPMARPNLGPLTTDWLQEF